MLWTILKFGLIGISLGAIRALYILISYNIKRIKEEKNHV